MYIRNMTATVVAFALLIMNSFHVYAETSDKSVDSVKAATPFLVGVKSEALDGKWLELDINIPVFSGLGNPLYQNQLNALIENTAFKDRKNIQKLSEEYRLKAERDGLEQRRLSLKIDYNIKTDRENFLSFTVTTYAFTESTGNTRVDCYNIQKRESHSLSLKDFFKVGVDYVTLINNEIGAQIQKRLKDIPGSYFSDSKGFKSILPSQTFYIEDGDLVICFPKYSIAPGYTENPEFRIPFESFGNLASDTSFSDRPFEVLSIETKSSEDSLSSNTRIPMVHGLKNKEYQQRLNRIIIDNASKDKQSVRTQHLNQKSMGNADIPYELKIDYTLESENGSYILKVNTLINTTYEPDEAQRTDIYCINPDKDADGEFDWANIPLLISGQDEFTDDSHAYLSSRNTLMLPLIKTAGDFGYQTEYDDETKTVTISAEYGVSYTVSLYSNVGTFYESIVLSQSGPYIREGVLYMPSGYFSSILGIDLILDQKGFISLYKK